MEAKRGPRTSRNRGFTLPELIVTVLIGMGLMAGIAIMFGKISEGLDFSRGFHSQLQKVDRFREDYSGYARAYPLPLGQTGTVASLSEFGFEAAAFANPAGDAGFAIGAVASSGTGFFVANQYPYGKYHPAIVLLGPTDITAIRSSSAAAFLSSLAVSRGKTYQDVLLSRLVVTDSETLAGSVRIDLSFLSGYRDSFEGKSFAAAKYEEGYDVNPLTLRNSVTAPWDKNGCFGTTKTVNGRAYAVPPLANMASSESETRAAIPNGTATYRQSFLCQNGNVVTNGGEVLASARCDPGFIWGGAVCIAI